MAQLSTHSANGWEEFDFQGRPFFRATVPRGDNQGQEFTVAKTLGGRYSVKSFFKSGGCGLLLRGRDLQTETDVLIKTILRYDVIHHYRGHDEEGFSAQLKKARKQLQTERRIMVQLKNRGCNAIPNPNDYVFDWNPMLRRPDPSDPRGDWEYPDNEMLSTEPYLIMEQVDGHPLSDEIGRGMEERRGLRIMNEVCHVLKLLHRPISRGRNVWKLVYQDLKPDNIIVGANDATLLLDFGGCRLTVDGQIALQGAYTVGYCPPECEGGELTAAADAWTVGSTLFHVFTGTSPAELLRSELAGNGPKYIRHDQWDWDKLRQRLSPATFEFLQRCLNTNPGERPPDADALCQEMAKLLRRP